MRPEGKTEAEVLFKEAKLLIEDARFLMATEKLNSIRSQFPYSYYATHAELLQADILFDQESYVEAAAAYILFKDFHPRHKKMAYVVWRIAESFNNQRPPSYDRDLSPLYEAIKYYDELLRVYSKSDLAKGGREKIEECKQLLKKKEQYIADFYYKTDVFQAARYRYLDILNNFSDRDLRNHSIVRVMRSSLKLKEPKNCKKYYKKFSKEVTGPVQKTIGSILKDCTSL
jgi:outer membrane protein assembly factor BamD